MTHPSDWTIFDPHLRIQVHPHEHGNTVTITHLPTGMQESEGRSTNPIINRSTALARLRNRVTSLP